MWRVGRSIGGIVVLFGRFPRMETVVASREMHWACRAFCTRRGGVQRSGNAGQRPSQKACPMRRACSAARSPSDKALFIIPHTQGQGCDASYQTPLSFQLFGEQSRDSNICSEIIISSESIALQKSNKYEHKTATDIAHLHTQRSYINVIMPSFDPITPCREKQRSSE